MENKRKATTTKWERKANQEHKSNLKQENYIHKKFSLGKSLKCLKDDDEHDDDDEDVEKGLRP